MPIHFRCPHCDKLLALGARKAGTQLPCPLCARILTVPPRTEVNLPTTIVVPPELTHGEVPIDADAWWLTTSSSVPAPPATVSTTEPEANVPPTLPEPLKEPFPVEPPALAPTVLLSRTNVLLLIGGILVAALAGLLILLLLHD